MNNFVILGLGYISEKHLKSIKDTGNNLIAAYDPSQSNIGKLDKYFYDCRYFKEVELFDDYVRDKKIDYVTICTPNYLHYNHINWAISKNAKVICEKPLVINFDHFKNLIGISEINCILQLRSNPYLLKLKEELSDKEHIINITYITRRGDWYDSTWQMDEKKSGGLLYNIGVHPLDMLCFLFGAHKEIISFEKGYRYIKAMIRFNKCIANLVLSIDKIDGLESYRKINIDGKTIDITPKFTDLHMSTYEKILNNEWYPLESLWNTFNLLNDLQNKK